jgi:hypothetical protein
MIPTASEADRKRLDEALNSLWKAAVAAHTNKPYKKLEAFNLDGLCDRLDKGRIKTSHDRYHRAWAALPKRKQPPDSDNSVNNKRLRVK